MKIIDTFEDKWTDYCSYASWRVSEFGWLFHDTRSFRVVVSNKECKIEGYCMYTSLLSCMYCASL